jgi:transcriptional regulator with XRE-family HTH domain
MPEPKVYEFSKHIGALCVTWGTDVYMLGQKLGVDPQELLRMVNGKVMPTNAVVQGLAKELDSDVRYLEKLADEIGMDLTQRLAAKSGTDTQGVRHQIGSPSPRQIDSR